MRFGITFIKGDIDSPDRMERSDTPRENRNTHMRTGGSFLPPDPLWIFPK